MKKIGLSRLRDEIKIISLSNEDLTKFGDGFEKAMEKVGDAIDKVAKESELEEIEDSKPLSNNKIKLIRKIAEIEMENSGELSERTSNLLIKILNQVL